MTPLWHQTSLDDLQRLLGSGPQGLSAGEAERRLIDHGPNELPHKEGRGALAMVAAQFADFLILLLLAAVLVSWFIGDVVDALAILAIVILNAIIGFLQEFRARKAMAALRKMAGQVATVIRDGSPVQLAAVELVPGDRILLETGNVVAADVRLVEVHRLALDESALTGESLSVDKETAAIPDPDLLLADRRNMAWKGTIVASGRGMGVVVATGEQTELGRIAALLQGAEEGPTPLQRRLAAFGRKLGAAILVICAVLFFHGIIRGEPAPQMLLVAIALAVAAIPEALPAVVTVSLALGAARMVRLQALIRRLPAVETLGSVTFICTDKTGTLTQNRMEVTTAYWDGLLRSVADPEPSVAPGENDNTSPAPLFLRAAALCTDAHTGGDGAVLGDPTETALYRLAARYSFLKEDLLRDSPRVAEIAFDPVRKAMTTFHAWQDGYVSFTKGALDGLIGGITTQLTTNGVTPFTPTPVLAEAESMAGQGLRVLALAMRRWDRLPESLSPDVAERDLTFLGLAGMMDPPRQEAREAVRLCKTAGITPVMITGDHPTTARTIGTLLGIVDDGEGVLTGRELAQLDDEGLKAKVETVRIYARVAPEDKLRIVRALQEKGELVAMTGDGVNDAPALKRADIGVAMGITGTDVAKEASAMILLDDNFATIVHAVREGRRIFANIVRFITYSITCNIGALVAITAAPLMGLPLPLQPTQILWLNLLTDSLPGLALAVEPAEPDVMARPPIEPGEGIFARGRGWEVVWLGCFIGAVALLLQVYLLRAGTHWQTILFTFFVVSRLAVATAHRSSRASILSLGLFSNRPLVGAVAVVVCAQLAAIYLPGLQMVFKTDPLNWQELALTGVAAFGIFLAIETRKLFGRLCSKA